MNESTDAVRIDNLTKTFHIGFFRRKVQALRGVSFHVNKGEIFGLLGPNGAGKTTTLKIMMGHIFPDSGTVQLLGKDGGTPASRKRIGYLPENAYFHEYLTPEELLKFYGELYGMARSDIRRRADELIHKVGLAEAARRPLRKFSKGMLQRIGLAQALLPDPDLLVLDEPMSGLDPIGRRFVADLISDLHKEGKTILFSSHILSDVERLCGRVVMLNRGIRVHEGSLAELLQGDDRTTPTLEEVFVQKAMEKA